jgi:hypothetical protein
MFCHHHSLDVLLTPTKDRHSQKRGKNHQVPVSSADKSCELLELNPKYPLQWKVEQYMKIEQTRGIFGI